MSYRWVYSSGKSGPVQTVRFTAPGTRQVRGEIIQTRAAGGGWAAIEMVSPAAPISNKARYRLLCGKTGANSDGVSAAASMQPAAKTVTCGAPPPTFTATGSITSAKAGTVTYYWALSDGQDSAPADLTFAAPGTVAVKPLTVTPQGDPATGEAVLAVTSPVTVTSSHRTHSLSFAQGPEPMGTEPMGPEPR